VRSLVFNYAQLAGSGFAKLIFIDTANSRNYGNVSNQEIDGIEKIFFLTHFDSDGFDGAALSVSSGIEALARYWSMCRPDAALVIADRTETLGAAAAASLMQIPLIHLQGGEITGSIDNKIRNANSALADFHLTTNDETATRLESLGVKSELIRVIGCPSIDIVRGVLNGKTSNLGSVLGGGIGKDVELDRNFGLIMFHPDTLNLSKTELHLGLIIETIKLRNEIQWVWFWPNSDHGSSNITKQMRLFRESNFGKQVKFLVNVLPEIFVELANRSSFILGNSSFGIREASFLGLPAINIGARQKCRQRATNVIDLLDPERFEELSKAIDVSLAVGRYAPSEMYGNGFAGVNGARHLLKWRPQVQN
jgi:UDP-hydrolysing UDP-N-acetyl-D-glucosamine 2-epimerase